MFSAQINRKASSLETYYFTNDFYLYRKILSFKEKFVLSSASDDRNAIINSRPLFSYRLFNLSTNGVKMFLFLSWTEGPVLLPFVCSRAIPKLWNKIDADFTSIILCKTKT